MFYPLFLRIPRNESFRTSESNTEVSGKNKCNPSHSRSVLCPYIFSPIPTVIYNLQKEYIKENLPHFHIATPSNNIPWYWSGVSCGVSCDVNGRGKRKSLETGQRYILRLTSVYASMNLGRGEYLFIHTAFNMVPCPTCNIFRGVERLI